MDSLALIENGLTDSASETLVDAKVLSVKWGRKGEHGKVLKLKYKGQPNSLVYFRVPRSACVTEGDVICSYERLHNNSTMVEDEAFIKCNNGFVQLTPIYSVDVNLQIGDIIIPIKIKEISDQDEHDGYTALAHY